MRAAVLPNRADHDCEEKPDPDERPDARKQYGTEDDEMSLTKSPDWRSRQMRTTRSGLNVLRKNLSDLRRIKAAPPPGP